MSRTGRVDDSAAGIGKTLENSIVQLSWAGLDRNGEFHAERLPNTHLRDLQIARIYADAVTVMHSPRNRFAFWIKLGPPMENLAHRHYASFKIEHGSEHTR